MYSKKICLDHYYYCTSTVSTQMVLATCSYIVKARQETTPLVNILRMDVHTNTICHQ